MLNNFELDEILEKLENLEDEELAVKLLADFNRLTSQHGKLILNLDKSLPHEEWKKKCDDLSQEISILVNKIMSL
jgi:hypothetical protein